MSNIHPRIILFKNLNYFYRVVLDDGTEQPNRWNWGEVVRWLEGGNRVFFGLEKKNFITLGGGGELILNELGFGMNYLYELYDEYYEENKLS